MECNATQPAGNEILRNMLGKSPSFDFFFVDVGSGTVGGTGGRSSLRLLAALVSEDELSFLVGVGVPLGSLHTEQFLSSLAL